MIVSYGLHPYCSWFINIQQFRFIAPGFTYHFAKRADELKIKRSPYYFAFLT